MRRWLCACVVLLVLGVGGVAPQQPAAEPGAAEPAADVLAEGSGIADLRGGGAEFDLVLSRGVPYRAFTLDAPPRLVLDFRGADFGRLDTGTLNAGDAITGLQAGIFEPGWSRLVAMLSGPMAITQAAMRLDGESGHAHLTVRLAPVGAEDFAARSGMPQDPGWRPASPAPVPAPRPGRSNGARPLVVVLDPGHGGVDPGAETAGIAEKDLMLTFARELRDVLLRGDDFQVMLTREDDRFVSLERRIALAHQARADVFISLHADSLIEGQAHGATVHVLSAEASDRASARLAERHDRDDLLAGVDLAGIDDEITDILLNLAQRETRPRSEALARALVEGISQTGSPMNRRPLRRAAFSVLKAADIPSVLVEVGFLSSPRDLRNLRDPRFRVTFAEGVRAGLEGWRQGDAEQRALRRR
ncbi:N-acetylmuramoyl-L-alanine amidase [Pontibaca methylaminivorans]|uniref:N-acetylmuramoyl-L-alanine amidase n=1 Tax=Pontibaca methylaminivorans TaxID=515897 RepID=A0A1R3X270_9RHOB|nr:N-acetylmuramoyl-L-alanine amidase [Pontibaca methylaminivorans]SIT84986.1 N-acetylmuramoyl-L-alanine amidase [Pontibaca methylaminivorans]